MMDQANEARALDTGWKSLYRVGAVSPLLIIAFYLVEMLTIAFGEPFPATVGDWFSLFQRNKILGLLYLNALDILSVALMGVVFLALYVALRQLNPSYMAVAALIGFIGVVVFIVPRTDSLAVMSLSSRYGAATSEVQRIQLLAAGEAINAPITATPQMPGFAFMAAALLIMSFVMLGSTHFGKAAAYLGILAGAATLADHISLVLAPSLAVPLMLAAGLFWIIWWILISRELFLLARA